MESTHQECSAQRLPTVSYQVECVHKQPGAFIKRHSYSRYDSDTDNIVPVLVAANGDADTENTGF